MALVVKEGSQKWQRNSANASADYLTGILSPRRPWAQSAQAAEGNFEAGINAAIADKAYGKGIQEAGDSEWQNGARTKGQANYRTGVGASLAKYQSKFQRFASALASVTLAPRGPKGTNGGRVDVVNAAMMAAKKQG